MNIPAVDYHFKPFQWEPTGIAGETAKKHADPHAEGVSMTLFAASFSPFVLRAWMALEYLEIPYHVSAVDLMEKPAELCTVSPKELVPALMLNDFTPPRGLNESLVIVEYLNDLAQAKGNKKILLPPVEYTWSRALIRLQADLVSRDIGPCFLRYLHDQDVDKREQLRQEFLTSVEKLLQLFERAEKEGEDGAPKIGLWQDEELLSLADVLVAPWLHLSTLVLRHYRNFSFAPLFPAYPHFEVYLDRLLRHPAFRATCSTDQLYLDFFAR
ncbi:hypothetical protein DL93DRAFT_2184909 [Clavulina sp. PMI_390]|nr:hypothetical protein DL93DRAFT_2184909 [Clavulina sp. PMI_390]